MKIEFEKQTKDVKKPIAYVTENGDFVWVIYDNDSTSLEEAQIIEIDKNGGINVSDSYNYGTVDFYNEKNQRIFFEGDEITITF